MEVPYEALEESDLFVDCVYKAGSQPNLAGEVISRLIPGSTNLGGFRKIFNQRYKGKDKKIAYVVLYTSLCELAWPDYLDVETGILRYYGDNRKAGRPLLETPGKGNLLLQRVFRQLHSGDRSEIPPFLIFSFLSARAQVVTCGSLVLRSLELQISHQTGSSKLTGTPSMATDSRIMKLTSRFSTPAVNLYPRRGFRLSGSETQIASDSRRRLGGILCEKGNPDFTL